MHVLVACGSAEVLSRGTEVLAIPIAVAQETVGRTNDASLLYLVATVGLESGAVSHGPIAVQAITRERRPDIEDATRDEEASALIFTGPSSPVEGRPTICPATNQVASLHVTQSPRPKVIT